MKRAWLNRSTRHKCVGHNGFFTRVQHESSEVGILSGTGVRGTGYPPGHRKDNHVGQANRQIGQTGQTGQITTLPRADHTEPTQHQVAAASYRAC
jgi:hypothetical protein